MNEQLRKAIQEATRVEPHREMGAGWVVDHIDHNASQAKLLCVIELLVEQRNQYIDCWLSCLNQMDGNIYTSFDLEEEISDEDAELIAALEGK